MLEIDVNDAIMSFVKKFVIARRRHLNNFFAKDFGAVACKRAVDSLITVRDLCPTGYQDVFCSIHPDRLHFNPWDYEDTLKCLDMFTNMLNSSDVKYFDLAEFPLNIRFMTVADELYDATYLDNNNWARKVSLLNIAWAKCIPVGAKDPFNHIAVVPSLDVAKKLRDYPFSQFIVVNSETGKVEGVYDN